MRTLTTDGAIVTTVEQEGEWTGDEVGRVWVRAPRTSRWTWYGFGSTDRANEAVADAGTLSHDALVAILEDQS